ncbi:hypothetical protein RWA05_07225 [Sinorhizobium meliloti]|uniref:hypothetical protein n=1 Tax=Rhizobium meliloti TaxID=382 RepID=UPI00299E66C0
MNVLDKKAFATFVSLGWKASKGTMSGDAALFMGDGDRELRAILQIRQLPHEQKIELHLSTGSKEVSKIVGAIFGAPLS